MRAHLLSIAALLAARGPTVKSDDDDDGQRSDAGAVTTYPALDLRNQPANAHDHTPAWDVFEIPIDGANGTQR